MKRTCSYIAPKIESLPCAYFTTLSTNRTKKSDYTAPAIERIELDMHISLQLNSDSSPEEEPTDWVNNHDKALIHDPMYT